MALAEKQQDDPHAHIVTFYAAFEARREPGGHHHRGHGGAHRDPGPRGDDEGENGPLGRFGREALIPSRVVSAPSAPAMSYFRTVPFPSRNRKRDGPSRHIAEKNGRGCPCSSSSGEPRNYDANFGTEEVPSTETRRVPRYATTPSPKPFGSL